MLISNKNACVHVYKGHNPNIIHVMQFLQWMYKFTSMYTVMQLAKLHIIRRFRCTRISVLSRSSEMTQTKNHLILGWGTIQTISR